jgi:hypothetical protein
VGGEGVGSVERYVECVRNVGRRLFELWQIQNDLKKAVIGCTALLFFWACSTTAGKQKGKW